MTLWHESKYKGPGAGLCLGGLRESEVWAQGGGGGSGVLRLGSHGENFGFCPK